MLGLLGPRGPRGSHANWGHALEEDPAGPPGNGRGAGFAGVAGTLSLGRARGTGPPRVVAGVAGVAGVPEVAGDGVLMQGFINNNNNNLHILK